MLKQGGAVSKPPLLVLGKSDHRVKRLEIGIFFRQIPKAAVHAETDLQIHFGVLDVAEQRIVTAHIIIVDWLFEERDGTGDEELLRFRSFAELMQTEASVEEAGAAIGGDAAEVLADPQRLRPLTFPHQVMEAQLQHLGTVLEARFNRVKFRERLARHAQFCVSAGGLHVPFELHASS